MIFTREHDNGGETDLRACPWRARTGREGPERDLEAVQQQGFAVAHEAEIQVKP